MRRARAGAACRQSGSKPKLSALSFRWPLSVCGQHGHSGRIDRRSCHPAGKWAAWYLAERGQRHPDSPGSGNGRDYLLIRRWASASARSRTGTVHREAWDATMPARTSRLWRNIRTASARLPRDEQIVLGPFDGGRRHGRNQVPRYFQNDLVFIDVTALRLQPPPTDWLEVTCWRESTRRIAWLGA